MIDLFVKVFPAFASALCLGAFFILTLRVQKLTGAQKLKERQPQPSDPLPGIVAGLKWELEALSGRLEKLETETRETPGQVNIRSGMNLNKRTQALRQYRLGQQPTEIAKALDMPKAEVDLLLKVHRLVSS